MGSSTNSLHADKTRALSEQLSRGAGPVGLAKDTSNLFRDRAGGAARRLDVRQFRDVLEVDPAAGWVDAEGMSTYEALTDACLARGVMPAVVPQLKTITLGGAVAGLGIESSSFRNGLPHESVLELEVLTGDGRVVVATPSNDHADLFRTFPNSYGTLGYSLRLVIELEPVKPFVRLRHLRFDTAQECLQAMGINFLVQEKYQLPQMNAVLCPAGVNEAEVRKTLLNEFGIEIGAGLGPLAGKIWRIGLMGYSCRPDNVMLCLSALGSVLSDMGLPVHVGDAEAAAHGAYAQMHVKDAQRKKRAA